MVLRYQDIYGPVEGSFDELLNYERNKSNRQLEDKRINQNRVRQVQGTSSFQRNSSEESAASNGKVSNSNILFKIRDESSALQNVDEAKNVAFENESNNGEITISLNTPTIDYSIENQCYCINLCTCDEKHNLNSYKASLKHESVNIKSMSSIENNINISMGIKCFCINVCRCDEKQNSNFYEASLKDESNNTVNIKSMLSIESDIIHMKPSDIVENNNVEICIHKSSNLEQSVIFDSSSNNNSNKISNSNHSNQCTKTIDDCVNVLSNDTCSDLNTSRDVFDNESSFDSLVSPLPYDFDDYDNTRKVKESFNLSEKSVSDDINFCTVDKFDNDVNTVKECKNVLIEDRKLIHINYFMTELHQKFDNHDNECPCALKDMRVYKYHDKGLRSRLYIQCNHCGYTDNAWTDSLDDTKIPLDESAVLATVTSGIGYNTLQKFLSGIGV
ncbi:ras guanine nucleotide exchange factor Q-like [Aphidius gifuensis]|uniref:ras guanine nucleotide exchange factor Q-like n=1 Tax=Aphidius gifuensis TaxID=684658 RepID=UPI001CDC1CD6|nr:ras guanine nucleotide exchange factor Q-like [Aphidius gifuensis]